MFRGTVDRAGTREGKKTSLRKTGKDKKTTSIDTKEEVLTRNKAVPQLVKEVHNGEAVIVDCGANLVNRHLESDLSNVIQRAVREGVCGMVIVTNDFEKSSNSLATSTLNPGVVYSVVGIHPSNISAKKMSDRLFTQLLQQLRVFSVDPHIVGLYAGLDYERDYGLKFPQEKFMKAQFALAQEMSLPMVLQDFGNGDALLEVMKDSRRTFDKGMIFNFQGSSSFLEKCLELDFYISFSGQICEVSDKGDQLRYLITVVPKNRILIISDSPNHTPQNIPDKFIRDSRNEPSNLVYVIQAAAKALNMKESDLKAQLLSNVKEFYNLSPTPTVTADNEDNEEENTTITTTDTNTTFKETKTTKLKPNKKVKEEDMESESEDEIDDESLQKMDKTILRLSEEDLKNLHYSCKKCRTKLFIAGDLVEHEEQSKVLDHNFVKQGGVGTNEQKKSVGCKSLFLPLREWMNIQEIYKDNQKIECPKCQTKLGSFSHGGEQCSCGMKLLESCRINKSRVDAVLLNAKGHIVDISSLNLNSDDESDSEDDLALSNRSKNKKGKKSKQGHIKKDNKRNLSNYRNKSDSVGVSSDKKKATLKTQKPAYVFGELSDSDDGNSEEEEETEKQTPKDKFGEMSDNSDDYEEDLE
ncbi:TatD-related deoxyribonuclease [Tieghemostelium lacteum]|uniref:TatD-related deoxyribonuclease n=1 Tax=Tieghemostelium lacteum TaxID=361077 RepID=A0A151Z881_TIELA|nr:TatD-related deoxyribonuclease [Tieghemostelium lacteum]|eukprot:KYQ89994.1 TatD-related deoxyribonuclease [Tieghemostelium lacteum]